MYINQSIDVSKLKKQIPFFDILRETIKTQNTDAFLVGGSVRNLLLGEPVNDWDFVVPQNAINLAQVIAKKTHSAFVLLDEELDIARIVPRNKDEIYLDFAGARGSLDEDLSLRDFTINSIALDMKTGKIIDPANGMVDLKNNIIRAKKRDNIVDDPLRILRGYRMEARFGFELEEETLRWMKELKDKLLKVSFERIRDEIFKILKSSSSYKIINKMYKDGILPVIIPEMPAMENLEQNKFHKFDVLEHSLVTYEETEKLIHSKKLPFEHSDEINAYLRENISGDRNILQLLKFATLLHDIGKPGSQTVNHLGHIYYRGHPIVGKEIWDKIARRFKLSNKEISLGGKFVEYHLEPIMVVKSEEGRQRQARLYRFYKNGGKSVPGVILLSWGDVEGGQGKLLTQEMIDFHHNYCRLMMKHYFEEDIIAKPPVFLTGKEIMEMLQMNSGKEVGDIIEKLQEAAALGEVSSKDEAKDFVTALNLREKDS